VPGGSAEQLVFSPASLGHRAGMAYLGARGGTARAMAGVLAAAGRRRAGTRGRAAVAIGGAARPGQPGRHVAGSNQVWADPSLRTLPSYLNAVATGYGAGVRQAAAACNRTRSGS